MAAFDLPFPPFPHDVREVPYITSPDDNNGHTVPSSQYFKKLVGGKYLWTPVSSTDPLPVGDAAAQATLTAIQGYIDGLEAVLGTAIASPTAYTVVARLKDLATALGEVGASPTANTVLARIKTLEGYLDGVEAALGATTDAEATGNGSVIAIVKQLRKLVTDAYATFGSAAPTKGLMVAGTDGTNARAIKTNEAGEVLTQLSGRKLKIKTINANSTTNVGAGATENVDITPTTGYKGKVLGILFSCVAPASASTGIHYLKMSNGTPMIPIRLSAAYNKTVLFDYCEKGADTTAYPVDARILYEAVTKLEYTADCPLRLAYTNSTDVAQTNIRQIYLVVEEEAIL